ncbi:hypothetical protein TWF594_003326 [Orbilia oligospora]|uniref:Uncharacterized protein n=1 Tax=Orbilia oligospora TaxID=2813651 RepID=A0A7C8JGU2_ORBOL|nr:hypothetical protein TWF703_001470 [Orbilia oligospora]KAF3146540.1 hypothetical protein TWF594_003326 [Orbilia oligospora]
MSTNIAAHIVNLPTKIFFKILGELDNSGEQQGLERGYSYPKATALGRPDTPTDLNRKPAHRFDAISRCCKKLRILISPFLFRYLRVNVSDEQIASILFRTYINSNWIFQYTKRLHFVVDIRAIIMAKLPTSVMVPNLNVLINLIAAFFQYTGRVEELHFIVKSEIVSNGIRRVFRWRRQQIENSLCNVRSLKFSAGSEWIIRFCGGYSGLQELENSPGLSGRVYVPYSIDFAGESSQFFEPPENSLHPHYYKSALSHVGEYKAANIMEGIFALRRGPETLTKVTIYGKFTTSGLDVFIKFIPFVSYLTIIGGAIQPNHAHILGQLPKLKLLNFEGGLGCPREAFESCPENITTLWHFARCIRTLQQMWVEGRFVGEIVRDTRGDVFHNHMIWRDTLVRCDILNSSSGDVEMGGG